MRDDIIDVIGTSKGRGFAGFMKRHGFAWRPRVTRLDVPPRAWRYWRFGLSVTSLSRGQRWRVIWVLSARRSKNLRVVRVDADENLILVRGAVPGPNGAYVLIKKAEDKL